MNKDSSTDQQAASKLIYESAFNKISDLLPYVSTSELLADLQLAVERISFSSIATTSNSQNPEFLKDKINQLLGADVPKNLISFCEYLIDGKILLLMDGDRGRYFLSYCSKMLKSIPQVEMFVPCKLHEHTKDRLAKNIQTMYDNPVRIVFNTSPSVIAGFVIRDGSKVIDMSLGGSATSLIKKHISNKFAGATGEIHG